MNEYGYKYNLKLNDKQGRNFYYCLCYPDDLRNENPTLSKQLDDWTNNNVFYYNNRIVFANDEEALITLRMIL